MLFGAEKTEEVTRGTTHVLFDPSADQTLKTPGDFLEWVQSHCSDENPSWLRDALAHGTLSLSRSE